MFFSNGTSTYYINEACVTHSDSGIVFGPGGDSGNKALECCFTSAPTCNWRGATERIFSLLLGKRGKDLLQLSGVSWWYLSSCCLIQEQVAERVEEKTFSTAVSNLCHSNLSMMIHEAIFLENHKEIKTGLRSHKCISRVINRMPQSYYLLSLNCERKFSNLAVPWWKGPDHGPSSPAALCQQPHHLLSH